MNRPVGSSLPASLKPTSNPQNPSKSNPTSKSQETSTTFKETEPTWRSLYLILYNFVSAILWAAVLGRVAAISGLYGRQHVFAGTDGFVRMVQSGAALEVLHSVVGLVRAPLMTTLMQVASRFLLVWGIAYFFPGPTSVNPAYASMLVAWSITEVIRYSYFAVNLAYGRVPDFLVWLRYNTFFVLYPLGIASECWLVYSAIEPARRWGIEYEWALKAVLFVYVPGAYVLYTHMMAQRRKVMRGLREEKKMQ